MYASSISTKYLHSTVREIDCAYSCKQFFKSFKFFFFTLFFFYIEKLQLKIYIPL